MYLSTKPLSIALYSFAWIYTEFTFQKTSKSGLYKIPLTADEIFNLTKEVGNIIRSVYKYETGQFEFRTLSWTELIGTEEPELDFLIEDVLPVGNLIILAGKPKLGKSLLALLFVISVCMGKQLWDKKVTQNGVLFISTEDGEIRLKKRIWKMLGDPDKHNPNCHFYVNNCVLTDKKVHGCIES